MKIKELVDYNLQNGCSLRDAHNLAAQEIIIRKIASSDLANHVTIKGGMVMYNLSKSNRRITRDIDFDLIRYSIDKSSIVLFVEKMNTVDDGIEVSINGDIEDLHQEDYRGVRVNLLLIDNKKNNLKIKLDIGVHTYTAIEQNKIAFNFESDRSGVSMKVNPPEQIFVEKLISLSRLGVLSTRYKDVSDMYYLIAECKISIEKVREILDLFLANSKRRPNTIFQLKNSIQDTLDDKYYIKEASKPESHWIDEDFETIKNTIIIFVNQL